MARPMRAAASGGAVFRRPHAAAVVKAPGRTSRGPLRARGPAVAAASPREPIEPPAAVDRLRDMRWSWVVVLVLVLAACGGPSVPESGATPKPKLTTHIDPPITPPGQATARTEQSPWQRSGQRPVAQWLQVGDLVAPGIGAVRPPHLVVYADGRAIADAAHELRLPAGEVKDLVKALKRDLAGQPATAVPKPGSVRA